MSHLIFEYGARNSKVDLQAYCAHSGGADDGGIMIYENINGSYQYVKTLKYTSQKDVINNFKTLCKKYGITKAWAIGYFDDPFDVSEL